MKLNVFFLNKYLLLERPTNEKKKNNLLVNVGKKKKKKQKDLTLLFALVKDNESNLPLRTASLH